MSSVEIYMVKPKGTLVRHGEAKNATAFYSVLWDMLARRYGHRDAVTYPYLFSDPGAKRMIETDEVIRTLPRQAALVLAATFDLTWFPAWLVPELRDALIWAWEIVKAEDARTYPTIAVVASAIHHVHSTHPRRGVTMDSSTVSGWCNTDFGGYKNALKEGVDATTLVSP